MTHLTMARTHVYIISDYKNSINNATGNSKNYSLHRPVIGFET
jgi:hypothetical protein